MEEFASEESSLLRSASEVRGEESIGDHSNERCDCSDEELGDLRKEVQLLRLREINYQRKLSKLEAAIEGMLEDNKELTLGVRQLMHENQNLQTQVRGILDRNRIFEQNGSLEEESTQFEVNSPETFHDSFEICFWQNQENSILHDELQRQHEDLQLMHQEQQLEFEEELASYQYKLDQALSQLAQERLETRKSGLLDGKSKGFSKSWHGAPSDKIISFRKSSLQSKSIQDFNLKEVDSEAKDLIEMKTECKQDYQNLTLNHAMVGAAVQPHKLGTPNAATVSPSLMTRRSSFAGKAA